jgi:hypothetical protein
MSGPTAAPVPPPVRASYLVVDDFMPQAVAEAMRAAIEAHFASPDRHRPESHMIWNYWYVPGLYTYLRTQPQRVFGEPLAQAFQQRLTAWCTATLGLGRVSHPYLSLYVDGCRQGLHNDSANGRFAFVYSLTKNVRQTAGGETLIWHEDDYFGTRLHQPNAGAGFYNAIPPRFNRLVVFDDRMPHAVQLVEGVMDPVEGRFALHGHISESGPLIEGPLAPRAVADAARAMANAFAGELGAVLPSLHGPVVVRFKAAADGTVSEARLLLDRLRRLGGGDISAADIAARLVERVASLRLPEAPADSIVTLPVGFGTRPA